MEKPTENLIKEEVEPNKGKRDGLEIERHNAQNLSQELSFVNARINHDEAVSLNDLEKIETAIKEIKVNFAGYFMTLEEIENSPIVKDFLKIISGEIKSGYNLTYITAGIAKILVEYAKEHEYNCDDLQSTIE